MAAHVETNRTWNHPQAEASNWLNNQIKWAKFTQFNCSIANNEVIGDWILCAELFNELSKQQRKSDMMSSSRKHKHRESSVNISTVFTWFFNVEIYDTAKQRQLALSQLCNVLAEFSYYIIAVASSMKSHKCIETLRNKIPLNKKTIKRVLMMDFWG